MSCASAVLCDPATDDIILAVHEDGSVSYVNLNTGAAFGGDPTTLTQCQSSSVTIQDNADNTVTIAYEDADGNVSSATLLENVLLNDGPIGNGRDIDAAADVILHDGNVADFSALTGSSIPVGKLSDGTLAVECFQWYEEFIECPDFPACAQVGRFVTEVNDAAELRDWLRLQYGDGMGYDEANCRVFGCISVDVVPDFTIRGNTGTVSLSHQGGNIEILLLATQDGSDWDVEWPDGTSQTGITSGTGATSPAGQPAGDVRITLNGCACVNQFDVTGAWDFDLADLNQFNCLGRILALNGNSITGDLADLPPLLNFFSLFGTNVTTGDIADLPATVTFYNNRGLNTTSGDVCELPAGLVTYVNNGANTTSGDIACLPPGLTTYINTGSSTSTGDICALPTGLVTYVNAGANTTSGDLSCLPTGLTNYTNTGSNTTTGDIATLPAGVTVYTNAGSNTTSGDLANLPAGLIVYDNTGNNTVTGDVANIPAGATTFQSAGQNTTFGDVGTIPAAGLTFYTNTGLNTTTYSTSYAFGSLTRNFISTPTVGHSSAEVDQILIDIAAAGLTPVAPANILLTGPNGAPTAASSAAITTLTGTGWLVTTN